MYYTVCKKCGASLDPGEHCECENLTPPKHRKKPSEKLKRKKNSSGGYMSPRRIIYHYDPSKDKFLDPLY